MNTRKALIIVDVQNDFCPGGALAVSGGDRIIPRINRLSAAFPVVAATMDWHPRGHVSFASSHKGKKPGDTVEVHGVTQYLWPDHCVGGSAGADIRADLDLNPVSLILRKGMNTHLDSYSGFFENDRKTATGLAGYLRELSVQEVYLCGLATDYCVFYTAMDARTLGFEASLLTDCAAGVDTPKGSMEKALTAMERAGVRLMESREM